MQSNGVSPSEFRRTSKCVSTKEAQDILQTTYEGTVIVKQSKLQRLTTAFETLRMDNNETFDEFYAKLNDIVFIPKKKMTLSTQASTWVRIFLKNRAVHKSLRSLPDRLESKFVAIKETKDLNAQRVDQLAGNQQTFEANLRSALKTSKEPEKAHDDSDDSDSEIDLQAIAFIVKKNTSNC